MSLAVLARLVSCVSEARGALVLKWVEAKRGYGAEGLVLTADGCEVALHFSMANHGRERWTIASEHGSWECAGIPDNLCAAIARALGDG